MRADDLHLRLCRLVRGIFSGDFASARRKVGGMELETLRPYEPGDELKAIHPFKTDLATGEPLVRITRMMAEAKTLFYIDASASEFYRQEGETKFELNLWVLGKLAPAFAKNECRNAFLAFSQRTEFLEESIITRTAIDANIARLRGLEPAGRTTDLNAALKATGYRNLRPDIVVILSDFASQTNFIDLLKNFRQQNILIFCIAALDPTEAKTFRTRGEIAVEDSETGATRNVSELGPPIQLAMLEASHFPVCRLVTGDTKEKNSRALIAYFEKMSKIHQRR